MILLVVAALLAASPLSAAEVKRPRLCPEDAPEGVRLPPRPGCGVPEAARPKRDPGYYELGDRITGRASAVVGGRH